LKFKYNYNNRCYSLIGLYIVNNFYKCCIKNRKLTTPLNKNKDTKFAEFFKDEPFEYNVTPGDNGYCK